jgi:UDPglucose 6-dehydrogenase
MSRVSLPSSTLAQSGVPFVTTDLVSAEMSKCAANAFLATKVSFINEVANLCELAGADFSEVTYGIGLAERIGPRFLNAGIGWGGSCFPKDVAGPRSVAREYDQGPVLFDDTVAVTERQLEQAIGKLQRDLRILKGKRIALLGLAFEPNSDDPRKASSLEIAKALDQCGVRVVGYDPVVAGKKAAGFLPNLEVVFDPYGAPSGARAAVVVTEWKEIRALQVVILATEKRRKEKAA